MTNPMLSLIPMQGVQQTGQTISGIFDDYYQGQDNSRQNALLDLRQHQAAVRERALQENSARAQAADARAAEAHATQQEAAKFEITKAQGAQLYRAFESLEGLDPQTRAAQIERMKPDLIKMGFDDDDWGILATDEGLAQGKQFLSQYEAQDPRTAAIAEFEAKAAAAGLEPGTPEYINAAKIDLGMVPRASTSAEERIAQNPELTGQVADSKATIAGAEVGAKDFAKFKQETIQQGLTARGLLKKANKLAELNELITTGKTAKARKFMGDLFGVTDPDLGQFNSLAGQLVLGQIRQLGANPTEGERAFLTEIAPSIENGGAVNAALIQDIADLAQGQIDRAMWFSNPENKEKSLEQYFLETGAEDFTPSSSVQAAPSEQTSSNSVRWDEL